MNARYRSVRYSASGRFAVLLPAVFAAGWVALAASSSCFGVFGLTQVSTTGRYTAANPSPDRLTTTANNATLKVTGGAAQPVLPFDQGLVVYSAAASQNATAVFVNRSTGWGCFYSVNGVYVSSGGTGVGGNTNTWNSWFKDRNKPRIAVAVNGPGKSNNIVLLGPNGGTLYVSVLGATGNFQVSLSATPAGNGGGALSGLPASVSVTGGNSQTAVPLNGATPGAVTITASTTATVDGSPNTTISASTQAIVAGFNVVISPNDQFSGRSYTKLGVGETGLLQVVTAAGVTPQSLGPFTLVVDSPTTLALSNLSTSAGTANFTAGSTGATATLSVSASNGYTVSMPITVTPPTGAYQVIGRQGALGPPGEPPFWYGVYMLNYTYLQPPDVSFRYLQVGEGTCKSTGTGYYATHIYTHAVWTRPEISGSGNISMGYLVMGPNAVSDNIPARFGGGVMPQPYDGVWTTFHLGSGSATVQWNIPWQYSVGTVSNQEFTRLLHQATYNGSTTMTISKGGVSATVLVPPQYQPPNPDLRPTAQLATRSSPECYNFDGSSTVNLSKGGVLMTQTLPARPEPDREGAANRRPRRE